MFLYAVYSFLLASVVFSCNFLCELSQAVTGETNLLLGDDLTLKCVLTEDFRNYTGSDIYFKLHYKTQGNPTCVPMSNVRQGENEATLVIHNITFQDVGAYGCYVGHCQDADIQLVGVSEDVIVEYPPENVTNFECVVYNWDRLINCTWEHNVHYVNESNINVSVMYAIPSASDQAYFWCPVPSYNGCIWPTEKIISTDDFYISVSVINLRHNISTTKVFSVSPSQLVKPDPVESLVIESSREMPMRLVLSWTHPRLYRHKIFRIRHRNVTDDMFSVVADNLTETNFTTDEYLPYTNHTFSVECFPTFPNSGYWSDPVYVNRRTPMTAPNFGPQIANGSFTTTSCVNELRNVTLMWDEVEESDRNGIIDSYLVKLGERNLIKTASEANFVTVELPCDSVSKLTIFAHNEEGYSLEPSVLIIPPVTFSVSKKLQESFSVEIMSSSHVSLHAVWEVGEWTENMNFTLFWCKGLQGKPCSGKKNWIQVAGTQEEYNFPIPSSSAEEYRFGISVTDMQKHLTSGIFWTQCLFNHNPENRQTVEHLKVDSGVNNVKVSWAQIPCTYQSKFKVTNYTVKWRQSNKIDETSEVYSFAVPPMEYMYTVSGLTANVKYSFTVQPVSYEDVAAEVQPWMEAVPTSSGGQTTILLPVLLGLFLPLASFILVAILCWRCKKGKERSKTLGSKKFSLPGDAGVFHPVPPRNCVPILLPQSSVSSSDSESDNMPTSPITHGNMSEHSDNHQQDRRTEHEHESNQDSVQDYQQIALSPINQSSDPGNRRNESASSYSVSIDPYKRLTVKFSKSSNSQTDLKDVADDIGTGKPCIGDLKVVNKKQKASIINNNSNTVAPVASSVLGCVSSTLNPDLPVLSEVCETRNTSSDHSLLDVGNAQCSESSGNGSNVRSSAGTSSQYNTGESQASTSGCQANTSGSQANTSGSQNTTSGSAASTNTSSLETDYIQFDTLRKSSTQSESSS